MPAQNHHVSVNYGADHIYHEGFGDPWGPDTYGRALMPGVTGATVNEESGW